MDQWVEIIMDQQLKVHGPTGQKIYMGQQVKVIIGTQTKEVELSLTGGVIVFIRRVDL